MQQYFFARACVHGRLCIYIVVPSLFLIKCIFVMTPALDPLIFWLFSSYIFPSMQTLGEDLVCVLDQLE